VSPASCEQYIDMMADYAEGVLRGPGVDVLRAHLASCASCAERLRSDDELLALLRRATDVEMPEDAKDRLRQLLASIREPRD
jgi:anti-sigma factor RsiW